MGGIGDMTPEEAAKLEADGAAQVAQQQADFAASQQPGPATPCDSSPDAIRAKGGYLLMDPQWVAGGPWNGIPAEEQQGEQNRRHDIVQQMKAGTAFGFTAEAGTTPTDTLDPFATDLAGWFPASAGGAANLAARTGDARVEYAIETGNQIVACQADAGQYVEGQG